MKRIVVPVMFALVAGLAAVPADAAGCLSGAAVGGVAGHVAGHHGVLGAGAGCVVGHHMANKDKAEKAAQDRNAGVPGGDANRSQ